MQHGRVRSRVRPVDAACMAAGPNALRGSGPNPSHAFKYALTQAGSPDPRNDRICITSSCDSSDLDRPTFHDAREPQPFRTMLSGVSDDSHCSNDEQPSQISISLL